MLFINRLVQFVHQQYEQKLLRSQVVCFILLETFQFASICQFNQRMNSFKRFTKKPARLSFLPENLPICDKKSNTPFASYVWSESLSSPIVVLYQVHAILIRILPRMKPLLYSYMYIIYKYIHLFCICICASLVKFEPHSDDMNESWWKPSTKSEAKRCAPAKSLEEAPEIDPPVPSENKWLAE